MDEEFEKLKLDPKIEDKVAKKEISKFTKSQPPPDSSNPVIMWRRSWHFRGENHKTNSDLKGYRKILNEDHMD